MQETWMHIMSFTINKRTTLTLYGTSEGVQGKHKVIAHTRGGKASVVSQGAFDKVRADLLASIKEKAYV